MNKHSHNSNSDDDDESSLAFDLLSCVEDDGMTDIVLIASDGERFPASRFVLGARSSVLRKLLFQENKGTFNLNYSFVVVSALVEFCRTNDIMGLVHSIPKDPTHRARELVHLEDCARYFEIPGLKKRTCDLVAALLQNQDGPYFPLACCIFDEATKQLASKKCSVRKLALRAIQKHPQEALLQQQQFRAAGVSSLTSQEALEEILSNSKLNCEEVIVFRALMEWSKSIYATSSASCKQALSPKQRLTIAKSMIMEYIDLTRIAPSDLLGIVVTSELVEQADIWVALKDVALRAEAECEGSLFTTKRKDASSWNDKKRSPSNLNQSRKSLVLEEDGSVQQFDPFDIHETTQVAFEQANPHGFGDLFSCDDRNVQQDTFRPHSPRQPADFEEALWTAPTTTPWQSPSRGRPNKGSPLRSSNKPASNLLTCSEWEDAFFLDPNKEISTSNFCLHAAEKKNVHKPADFEEALRMAPTTAHQQSPSRTNKGSPIRSSNKAASDLSTCSDWEEASFLNSNEETSTSNFSPHAVEEKKVVPGKDVNYSSSSSVVEAMADDEVSHQSKRKIIKGRLVSLADKLSTVCICGSLDTTTIEQ